MNYVFAFFCVLMALDIAEGASNQSSDIDKQWQYLFALAWMIGAGLFCFLRWERE